MLPVLFKIGHFELRSWGLTFAIAVILGAWIAGKRAKKFSLTANTIFDFALIIVLAALIGSRLWYVAFHLAEFRGNWLDIINPFHDEYFGIAGMSMVGGVVLAIISAAWLAVKRKVNFSDLGDAMAPSFLLGEGLQRLGGCFLQGCCFGAPTRRFWGIVFPPEGVAGSVFPNTPLHPTQLMASVLAFIGFALILWLERWHKFKGFTLWLVFAYYSLARFFVDQLRYYETPQVLGRIGPVVINVNSILLLGLLIVSLTFLLLGWRRQQKTI